MSLPQYSILETKTNPGDENWRHVKSMQNKLVWTVAEELTGRTQKRPKTLSPPVGPLLSGNSLSKLKTPGMVLGIKLRPLLQKEEFGTILMSSKFSIALLHELVIGVHFTHFGIFDWKVYATRKKNPFS